NRLVLGGTMPAPTDVYCALIQGGEMQKLVVGFALLALLSASMCLTAAQITSVTFQTCNAGKTDVDVFFSQSGQVTTKHISPADCAPVAYKEGAMAPGYVGLAFTDARGQWGAARRQDLILDSD